MVRLKVYDVFEQEAIVSLFQFLNGAIKSVILFIDVFINPNFNS